MGKSAEEELRAATFSPVLDAWYLTGPTASGKTRVALELAKRLNAEIISLDSMAIYRGMDIGTAKPTLADREQIPHHLIDLVEPTVNYSLSAYVQAAHAAVADIRGRGREALFVGGTPLYLKSLLRGVFPGPPADWDFRGQIEDDLKIHGLPALHERLKLVDPLSAARLHPHDKRRIIRALEVVRMTGQPLSHRQTQFDQGTPPHKCKVFVLAWPRPDLHQRIDARVERMFALGLVEEIRQLLQCHGRLGRTASQAVGYREVLQYLQDQWDLPATIERAKTRTRQFARRQDTWFRNLQECRPVPQSDSTAANETAEEIIRLATEIQ